MADPIVEQIRAAIKARVASVTTANGYDLTLTIESVKRHGNSAGHLTAVIEQGDETPLAPEEPGGAVGFQTYDQMFLVFIHIMEQETDDYDGLCNSVTASVRKAVMADVTFGNLAIHTAIEGTKLFANDGGEVAGVMVPFKVHYRHNLDNPFEA